MLKIPTHERAEEYLLEASKLNPGSWIEHSKNVALAAKIIASRCTEIDPSAAYILGLLHDIGRREGKTQARHALDGYKFMISQGFDDCARICMTHTFQHKNVSGIYDLWDCSDEELIIISNYLKAIEYNDYDLLLQLCDAVSLDNGFCLLEKKMVSSAVKFGLKDMLIEKWKAIFKIKEYFENKINCSIYSLLPNITEKTFDFL